VSIYEQQNAKIMRSTTNNVKSISLKKILKILKPENYGQPRQFFETSVTDAPIETIGCL
jgi:hypothetical protein